MQGPLNLKNKLQSSPLVSISKASTPIRHRVMSNNNANSTPINPNKLESKQKSAASNNKQNYNQANNINSILSNSKGLNEKINNQKQKNQTPTIMTMNLEKFKSVQNNESNERKFQKSSVNLSPIMALNRKLSQGHLKMQNFRSLTPNAMKSNDSFEDACYQNIADNQSKSKYANSNNLKKDSSQASNKSLRDKTNLNFALTGLRNSNSFTNVFQGQCRSTSPTPTRLGSLALNSLGKKNSIQSSLKSSIKDINIRSSDRFGGNLLPHARKMGDSIRKKSLIGSKSFDRITNISSEHQALFQNQVKAVISPRDQKGEIMCNNNHNKKAKYRVKIEEQNDQILAYCSKCAIQLVQKGFSVEELQASISSMNLGIQNQDRISENYQNYQNYSSVGSPKLNFRDSNSFKNKFQNYKNSYIQSQQGFKIGESIKAKLMQKKQELQRQNKQFQSIFQRDCEEIDCYYNSIINYVEQQRKMDKQRVIDQKKQYQRKFTTVPIMNNIEFVINQVSQLLQNRNIDTYTLKKQIKQIQAKNIGLFDISSPVLVDKFVYLNQDMQIQFDNFAQNFTHFSLKFDTGTNQKRHKSYHIGKNNALRFSFEKALQIQKRKQFLQGNNMRTLHEESEQYEDNSYGDDNMMENMNSQMNKTNKMIGKEQQNSISQSQDQKNQPFRTLFPQEDEQYDQNYLNNQAYSPNFKVI